MATLHPNWHPLQIDPQNGEPYLRLPVPLDNIIITPPRLDDADSLVKTLGHDDVVKWLTAIPKPYGLQDAESWLEASKQQTDEVLRELDETHAGDPGTFVERCPVRTIRECQADGTQVLIGSIGVGRCSFSYLEDEEMGKHLAVQNRSREVGDPDIIWEVGGKCSQPRFAKIGDGKV